MKALATFVVAALASAVIHSQLGGCALSGDCECPPVPERPEAQAGLRIGLAMGWSQTGGEDALPLDPTGGTVEITADRLVIRYEWAGVQREVAYDVLSSEL